jgi:hypothetical protein
MAAVVIGGTLVSVVFFVFLVPVMYNFFEALSSGFGWFTRKVIGLGDETAAEPEVAVS